MNVRLKRKVAWSSGLVFQEKFCVNHYTVELSLMTLTTDPLEQNIAYDRLKHFVYAILGDSILISTDSKSLSKWQDTGTQMVVLPEEPVDQIVGMMLYSKLNAIMEGRIIVTDIELSSHQGDDMIYCHSDDENLGPFDSDGWWTDVTPNTHSRVKTGTKKVVALGKKLEWTDFDLDWESTKEDSSSVVFANFKQDENK